MPRYIVDADLRAAFSFDAEDDEAAKARLLDLLDNGRLDCAEVDLPVGLYGALRTAEVSILSETVTLYDDDREVPL